MTLCQIKTTEASFGLTGLHISHLRTQDMSEERPTEEGVVELVDVQNSHGLPFITKDAQRLGRKPNPPIPIFASDVLPAVLTNNSSG